MKRYMTRVSVLLLAGILLSCGGGGDDSPSGGGSTATPSGGSPAAPGGGSTATPGGGGSAVPSGGGTAGGTSGTTTGGGAANNSGGSTGIASARPPVEESSAAVTLSDGWTESDPRFGWSGGSALQATAAGTTASFTFTGTSVRWIGGRSREGGIALVSVDGGPAREVDLFARPREIRTSIITLYDLGEGQHTLTIQVTGRKNPDADSSVVIVDAFEVDPPIVSHFQETDPDLLFSGSWAQADSGLPWSGCCVRTLPDPPMGGAKVAELAGAKVTLKFRGTSIRWIGYRGPNGGMARVTVDGVASVVDTYSPKVKVQEVVFAATGLTDATHTLTIEATGLKNGASTGAQVVVDAFDVTTPGRRYQEDHPNISYTGAWADGADRNVSRVWSEGASATSPQAGATATFTFTGTSVSWISCQKSSIGRAKVFIDGAFVREIDNHRRGSIEAYQRDVFRMDGLTNGTHTLTIEVVSDGPYTVVDAFDVRP